MRPMRILVTAMVIVSMMSFAAQPAFAFINPFDGHRKGFVLRGGLGPGITHVKTSKDLTKAGLALDLQIGYAPTDRVSIDLTYRTSMFLIDQWDEAWDEFLHTGDKLTDLGRFMLAMVPVTWLIIPQSLSHTVAGVGMTYYFSDEEPSFFMNGGVGPSSFADPYKKDTESALLYDVRSGLGLYAGAGYEFHRHLNMEFSYMWSKSSEGRLGLRGESTASSWLIKFNVLGY